ncbi:helix-turn-helix domain-containing protein [Nocardia farcinica]|uniref:Putative DNA-binding protein n=1 Tax=Nocardia farcinica (strain IFM 10152) TaxID=247156 RepID=Q5YPN7_NOCFA|nr:XRE family transcriptional regulator [Nocardia farcinica]BAD59854.1 putative DNA-binding protein [Nocardia farcinica IFM 10152]
MDEALLAVGERIRSRLPGGTSQRKLAELVGMKPDALSRALNGQRGFSTIELARIADVIEADLYWLITGRRDPRRVEIAARHTWDGTGRTNPGRADDDALLDQVIDLYQAAYPDGPPSTESLPDNPQRMRAVLGDSFVRSFGMATQKFLGVDVIRLPGLSTDYSLTIGTRAIVILTTTSSWSRSNWSMAHELAHLALGHHNGHKPPDEQNEAPANRFAAQLLLPEDVVRELDWANMTEAGTARFLWRTGVSTTALKVRLTSLKIDASHEVLAALEKSTPRLIRAYADDDPEIGGKAEVTLRSQESSARAIPPALVDALERRVEDGSISPEYLAWALDVPVDDIDFPEPDDTALVDRYERSLENRLSGADVREWLATSGRGGR